MTYCMTGGLLAINGREVVLPYPPVQVLEFHNIYIVRVEPSKGKIFNKNVFAVNSCGGIIWQIAESPHGTQQDKPYTSIYVSDGGYLIAGNWNGVDYLVDEEDGSIRPELFRK